MDTQDFKKKLIKMRDAINDYLDNLDMDLDETVKNPEKKPEPKGSDKSGPEEDEDGKKKEH